MKVSVIIPVYNAGRFLSKCLDSVLAQTMPDIEIICINDGSTDNSGNILDEYLARDERIKIINKKNAGVSMARNDGIRAASGEYIHFLDADDFIDSNYYEKMLDGLDCDIACSGFVADSKYTNGIKYKKNYVAKTTFAKFWTTYALTDSYVWRYLFNRKFLIKNQLKFDVNLIAGEDAVFLMGALYAANCVALRADTLYHYVFNNTSALNNRDKKHHARIRENYKRVRQIKVEFARKNKLMLIWRTRKIRGFLCQKFQ